MTDHVETTLPYLSFTASVPGDAGALTRLLIDDDQSVDRRWVAFGFESENYSASANAEPFYQAEGRTALGGSAIAAGPSGASGAGSNVMRNTALAASYQAIMGTQATGGGAHLSHVGKFNVIARVQVPTTNIGTVSVALEWDEGDFRRPTQNPTWTIDPVWEGTWQIAKLGQVSLSKVSSGTQRWEARVLAKSTVAGDDIDIDWIMLIPYAEGYGEAAAVFQIQTPTSFSARDEFDQSAGALAGKTAPVGGVWAGAGDADDFTVETTGRTAQRTAVSDANENTGRYAVSGVTGFAAQVVEASFKWSLTVSHVGVIARYTDTSNWFMATLGFAPGGVTGGPANLYVRKRVAGTVVDLATNLELPSIANDTFYTIRIAIDATGLWRVWLYPTGGFPGSPIKIGVHADLATGGALASGKPGIYDAQAAAPASTRNYDNFASWVPVADAAIFAGQSIVIRSDAVEREDSAGALWTRVSSYEGALPVAPPAGAEARTLRVVIFASRSVPGEGPDSGIDDISAKLYARARYL